MLLRLALQQAGDQKGKSAETEWPVPNGEHRLSRGFATHEVGCWEKDRLI